MIKYNQNISDVVNNDLVNKAQEPDKQTFYQKHPYLANIGITTATIASLATPAFASPTIMQRGLEHIKGYFTDNTTVDDHLKEGWEKGGIEVLKGAGKALAFAVPYTARDVLMLPIAIPKGLYKNIGKTSEFLNMGNEDAHILTKSGKVVVFVPAYAYKIAEGAVKKAIKDPCQTTLDLAAASLIVGKVLAENKAVSQDLGIYKSRQRDSQNAEVVVEEKPKGGAGGD